MVVEGRVSLAVEVPALAVAEGEGGGLTPRGAARRERARERRERRERSRTAGKAESGAAPVSSGSPGGTPLRVARSRGGFRRERGFGLSPEGGAHAQSPTGDELLGTPTGTSADAGGSTAGPTAAARDARQQRRYRADRGRAHLAVFAADEVSLLEKHVISPGAEEAAGGGTDFSGAPPPELEARLKRRERAVAGRADLERFSAGLAIGSSRPPTSAPEVAPSATGVSRARAERRGRAEAGRSSLERFSADAARATSGPDDMEGGGPAGRHGELDGRGGLCSGVDDPETEKDNRASRSPVSPRRMEASSGLSACPAVEQELSRRLEVVAAATAVDDVRASLMALLSMEKDFGELSEAPRSLPGRVSEKLAQELVSARRPLSVRPGVPRMNGAVKTRGGNSASSALQEVLASEFGADLDVERTTLRPTATQRKISGANLQHFSHVPLIWARSVTRRYHDLAEGLYRRGRPDRALEALDAVLGERAAERPRGATALPRPAPDVFDSPRASASLKNLRGCILSDMGLPDDSTTEIEAALLVLELGQSSAGSRSPPAERPSSAVPTLRRGSPVHCAGARSPPRCKAGRGAELQREAGPRAALGVALLHNLAVVYRKQGRLREALESQEAASGLFSSLLQLNDEARSLVTRRHPWEASLRNLGRSLVALQLQEAH